MLLRHFLKPVIFATAISALVSGCTFFPSQGPNSSTINTGEGQAVNQSYVVIKLTPEVTKFLETRPSDSLAGTFTDRRPAPDLRVGVGDVVTVTIFEAAPGGLFTPGQSAGARPGNYVELPPQIVNRNGNISVPYAGLVTASGRSLTQIQATIEDRLRNRAIEPQAIVSLREQRATQVSVLGEVNISQKFALNPAGERILDVIARAGGPKYPSYETAVTLQRRGRKATVAFGRLILNPANNIYTQPGDVVYLAREQRSFAALGASGLNGQFNFDSETVNLAQAVGKSGGLLDERADPGAVFLYRTEPRSLVEKMGTDVSGFEGKTIPVIYSLDLRDPSGFFLAKQVDMRNKDIIFVANAASVEITKFLQFVRIGVATVREGDVLNKTIGTD